MHRKHCHYLLQISRAQEFEMNMLRFFPQAALLQVASIFGFLECCTLLWYEYRKGGLPCINSACHALQSSPLANPVGIPLPWLGFVHYAGIIILSQVWLRAESQLAWRLLGFLTATGALMSLGLLVAAWQIAGAICPWCAASAVASFLACAGYFMVETSSPEQSGRTGNTFSNLVLVAVPILALAILVRASTPKVLNEDVLAQLPEAQLAPADRALQEDRSTVVAWVDFGCGSCRQILRRLRSHRKLATLRFVKPMTQYSEMAALVYLDAKDPAMRIQVVDELLSDDSRTTERLKAIRIRLGLRAEPHRKARQKLMEDAQLAAALELVATPTLIVIGPNGAAVKSIGDLIREPSSMDVLETPGL